MIGVLLALFGLTCLRKKAFFQTRPAVDKSVDETSPGRARKLPVNQGRARDLPICGLFSLLNHINKIMPRRNPCACWVSARYARKLCINAVWARPRAGLVKLGTGGVDRLDQRSNMLRGRELRDAVAEIEHMASAVAVAG